MGGGGRQNTIFKTRWDIQDSKQHETNNEVDFLCRTDNVFH
jgi:hypothetical protein